MLKRVVLYGELRRPERIAGWVLMILAAACCFTGAFLSYRRTEGLLRQIDQPSMTAEQIKAQVATITQAMGRDEALVWTAGGLFILAAACFQFGRRLPPVSGGKETPEA